MAFSTRRGRPRSRSEAVDRGTPELQARQRQNATSEPLDLCLHKALITPDQHWCGMHLRWLYTLRYGAPSLTTHYTDAPHGLPAMSGQEEWRAMREHEYNEARALLVTHRRYEPVMRLSIYHELPAFLHPQLQQRAWSQPALAHRLAAEHHALREGLELLVRHWRKGAQASPPRPATPA